MIVSNFVFYLKKMLQITFLSINKLLFFLLINLLTIFPISPTFVRSVKYQKKLLKVLISAR